MKNCVLCFNSFFKKRFKKFLLYNILILLLLGLVFSSACYGEEIPKENVSKNDMDYMNEKKWAYSDIQWGLGNRFVTDSEIKTNAILTKKQLAILIRSVFSKLLNASSEKNKLYWEKINKAESWLVGADAHKPASREDMIYIITSIIWDGKATDAELRKVFKDSDKIRPGFVQYVNYAFLNGIVKGYDDKTLRPDKELELVEAVVFLHRISESKLFILPDDTLVTKQTYDRESMKSLYYKYKDSFYKEGIDLSKPIPKDVWFSMVNDFTSYLTFKGDNKEYWLKVYTIQMSQEKYLKREDAIGGLIKILSMFTDINMTGNNTDVQTLKKNFADVEDISDRQLGLIAIAYRDNIVRFYDKKIRPKEYLTYGEALGDLIHDAFKIEK